MSQADQDRLRAIDPIAPRGADRGSGPSRLFHLGDRVVLVTGGTKGIGRAIVRELVAHGARVAFCSRDRAAAEAQAAELNRAWSGDVAFGMAADITDPGDMAAMVGNVVSRWGRLDSFVSNAAVLSYRGPSRDTPHELFQRLLEVNIRTTFSLCRMMAGHMDGSKGGSIVLITSNAAFRTNPNVLAYASSKAGETHLAACLAAELASSGIRVNCVAPGLTRTEGSRSVWADPVSLAAATASIPLGRIGEAEDQAAAVVYLLSDAARQVSGTTLIVDGGAFEPSDPSHGRMTA